MDDLESPLAPLQQPGTSNISTDEMGYLLIQQQQVLLAIIRDLELIKDTIEALP